MLAINAVVACILAALLSSCSASLASEPNLHDTSSTSLRMFFRKPLKVQLSEFRDYEFERQYAIFIYGNQVIHPPAIYLAEPLAREGGAVAGPLKGKLAEANDDLTIRDIIYVFGQMYKLKTYNVAGDDELIKLMNESIHRMKNPDWKRITEQVASEMGK